MSGDVFGNGMLLVENRSSLVAAFDHRHIFIDPDPDPAVSWKERERMFNLPRSSWEDYDPALLSRGRRHLQAVGQVDPAEPRNPRAARHSTPRRIDPASLINAILKAPVDLLWFGGIGTYIKASTQNHADVGDPANDGLRVSADELAAKVIGEGANLAITQAGRIEFARPGGRINTDFIDNSAGVDCSDNEVNIKIPLNREMREGKLELAARNRLLARMTDEVVRAGAGGQSPAVAGAVDRREPAARRRFRGRSVRSNCSRLRSASIAGSKALAAATNCFAAARKGAA